MDSPGRQPWKDGKGEEEDSCKYTIHPLALRAEGSNSIQYSSFWKEENDFEILTQQKSFAGVLTYALGDVSHDEYRSVALAKDPILSDLVTSTSPPSPAIPLCTCIWRRDIDYQPPSIYPDVGICASYSPLTQDGCIDLRETGQDGSYAEGWHREMNTHRGPFMALELISEQDGLDTNDSRVGYWVRAGSWFAYAIGRPRKKKEGQEEEEEDSNSQMEHEVGKSLQEVIQSYCSTREEQMALLGTYVAVAGVIDQDTGAWNIQYSTNPCLVGCLLVCNNSEEMKSNAKTWCSFCTSSKNGLLKEGDTVKQVLAGEGTFSREWKIIELSGCSPPIIE